MIDFEHRKTYLGGTDIAKIVGASRYGGPYDVYLQKTGQDPFDGNAATKAGQYLESAVAAMYADETGRTVTPGKLVMHPEYSFLGGNPDYLTDNPNLGLEIKTAAEEMLRQLDSDGGPLWGDDGTDIVPMAYLVQCQWYMGLTGKRKWDLACFFLGPRREFRVYRLDFDPDLFPLMVAKGVEFWTRHMVPGVPPDVDALPSDLVRSHLMRKAEKAGLAVQSDEEGDALMDQYRVAYDARKKAEEMESFGKARLIEYMARREAKKLQGALNGKKWSINIQGGGTESRVNHAALQKEYHSRLLSLGMREEDIEALEASHTTTFEKSPYIRGYFNALKQKDSE